MRDFGCLGTIVAIQALIRVLPLPSDIWKCWMDECQGRVRPLWGGIPSAGGTGAGRWWWGAVSPARPRACVWGAEHIWAPSFGIGKEPCHASCISSRTPSYGSHLGAGVQPVVRERASVHGAVQFSSAAGLASLCWKLCKAPPRGAGQSWEPCGEPSWAQGRLCFLLRLARGPHSRQGESRIPP